MICRIIEIATVLAAVPKKTTESGAAQIDCGFFHRQRRFDAVFFAVGCRCHRKAFGEQLLQLFAFGKHGIGCLSGKKYHPVNLEIRKRIAEPNVHIEFYFAAVFSYGNGFFCMVELRREFYYGFYLIRDDLAVFIAYDTAIDIILCCGIIFP